MKFNINKGVMYDDCKELNYITKITDDKIWSIDDLYDSNDGFKEAYYRLSELENIVSIIFYTDIFYI